MHYEIINCSNSNIRKNGKTSPNRLCHSLEHYAQGRQGEGPAYRRGLLRHLVWSV